MQTQQTIIEQEIYEGVTLNPIEAEKPQVVDDILPHYVMSFLLEIPLYNFTGTKSFGEFNITVNGEQKPLDKIQPFVLIPIQNSVKDGPAQYLSRGIPDRDNPETFNPLLVERNSGATTRFPFTAKQNAEKLLRELGTFGVFLFKSLTGRTDAQEIVNVVLPTNNTTVFPRTVRQYRATTRTGVFADQVADYLRNKAADNLRNNQSLNDEQKGIAWKFLGEAVQAIDKVMSFCESQVNRIATEIEKGIRSPFSFSKETSDAVYPFDFMILANLDIPEPKVTRPTMQQMQTQTPSADSELIRQLVASQIQTNQLLAAIVQGNKAEFPQSPNLTVPEASPEVPAFAGIDEELFGENTGSQPKRTISDETRQKMMASRKANAEAKKQAETAN